MEKNADHPEVADIKHICSILPRTKENQAICEQVNKEKRVAAHIKKSHKSKK